MTGKKRIQTCLWFDHGQAREAAEFYASIFPDSRVEAAHAAASDYPDGKQGDELTVEFTVLGMPFVGLNGGPYFKFNEAVSFQVYTEDQEETDRYWNAIVGNGGSEAPCGWCKDKFGLSWQIVPCLLLEAMADPDQQAAKRAMDAMMDMTRIDIATIKRARAGESAA
jgi:predicted 3-demethylubiquinone-9 3-methyltransferase (glyoxalase superfamily)